MAIPELQKTRFKNVVAKGQMFYPALSQKPQSKKKNRVFDANI